MTFDTTTFRLDARFDGTADLSASGPASIVYAIHDRESWSLLAVKGKAARRVRQFITED